MKRKKIYGIFMLVAIAVFLFAGGRILQIYLNYQESQKVYEQMEEFTQKIEDQDLSPEAVPGETPEEVAEQGFLQVDFNKLEEINPDVIAWIEIPGLEISYPVVQGRDNDYYLHHLITGENHKSGSIFMDFHNQEDLSDRNSIIYGHNMKDGSMFGTLDQYQSQALYRNYPCFYMYVPGYIYEYQIFSCYAAPTDHPAYTYDFPTSEDYEVFLETLQRSAEYNTGTTVTREDQVVTLSTCVNTRKDYRYLVHGKLKQNCISEMQCSVVKEKYLKRAEQEWNTRKITLGSTLEGRDYEPKYIVKDVEKQLLRYQQADSGEDAELKKFINDFHSLYLNRKVQYDPKTVACGASLVRLMYELMISGMGWDKVKQALEIEKKLGMEHLSGPEKGQKIRKLRNQFIQEFGKDSVIPASTLKGKDLKRVFWAVVNIDNLNKIEGMI